MPFCPVCEKEFPARSRCPKHGGLVELLQTGTDRDGDDRPVLAATAFSEMMASSWAQLLGNNGIPTMVKVGGPGFSLGGPPPFGYQSYIYVPDGYQSRARSILEAFEGPGTLELRPEDFDESG